MSRFTLGAFAVTALTGAALGLTEDKPEFELPKPKPQHAWLKQLEGEWESEAKMFMEAGKPPVVSKGTESVRAIGEFWIVAESKGTFMEAPFTGMLTLGYDPREKSYIGTWIDSVNDYLWTYKGSVDKAGKVLTLESEGPCPTAPGKLSQFKEVLEIKDKDHKVFSSSLKGEDGKWTTMMTIEYRKKR